MLNNHGIRFHRRVLAYLAVTVFILLGVSVSDASAQQVYRRPPPTRSPTLSPYLNLLGPRRGPLPNYFERVRPQQRLLSTLQQQDRAIQRQERQLQVVDRRLDSSRQTEVAPTGVVGAGFVQYLHFYPGLNR